MFNGKALVLLRNTAQHMVNSATVDNAVGYFCSYYDYCSARNMPVSDVYVRLSDNEELDKLRLQATIDY